MSNTNRALNRILLALAGLVLLAAGAVTAAAGLVPDIAAAWTATGTFLADQARAALGSAPLPGRPGSWWSVAAVAVFLIAAALSVAWLASQGGGRTPRLARDDDGDRGATTIDAGLIGTAVGEALDGNRLVVGSNVSAWENRRGTGLRLRLEARKGASPRELADTAEELVRGIDALIGHPVPVLVRITAGVRSRVAGADRAR